VTALIQNFSVPAANDVQITLNVAPDQNLDTLDNVVIYWRVYPQSFGIPDFDGSPLTLIEKSTLDGSIALVSSPASMECQIRLLRDDTAYLLRNYYHETTMTDSAGNVSTLNEGIMTVTDTRNRP
jgi:hypothetical protein